MSSKPANPSLPSANTESTSQQSYLVSSIASSLAASIGITNPSLATTLAPHIYTQSPNFQPTTTSSSLAGHQTQNAEHLSSPSSRLPETTSPASLSSSIFSTHYQAFSSSFSPTTIPATSVASSTSQVTLSTTVLQALSSTLPTTIASTISTTSPTAHSSNAPPNQNQNSHQQNDNFKPERLAKVDLIIIVIYLCLIVSTSISSWLRVRHKRNKLKHSSRNKLVDDQSSITTANESTTSSILPPRKMNWFTVGASIYASNMGTDLFIGLSGSGASSGLGVAAFEVSALILMQAATWIFLPVLIVSKISTLPEYMSKRFGGSRIRTYLAMLAILLYIFTKVSVNLFSGGIFIQQAIGINLYASAMLVLAITALMTLTGGARGAMLVDQAQAWIITIGASLVLSRSLTAIGGWSGLQQRYALSTPSKVPAELATCAAPNQRAFQILRPLDDKHTPWLGFILGQLPTGGLWYWCADQSVMQRFLSARSLAHAQGASIFAGYLKVLPLIFMVIPGMISRALFVDEVGCIDPLECQKYCQSSVSCSNTAYPRLVLELLPTGARGMMVATMVAALIGDLCNVFNSASALFACDIYPMIACQFRSAMAAHKRARSNDDRNNHNASMRVTNFPQASQKELTLVSRIFILVLVVASIMWIPVIQEMQGGQLFIYIQAVSSLFAPPITAVYLCAIFWKRTNEAGAFWSLMLGFCLGCYRMLLAFFYIEPSNCNDKSIVIDERPIMLKMHYMYYALFLFIISIISIVIISSLTKPPASFRLIRTTFWTRFDTSVRADDRNSFEMQKTSNSDTSKHKLSSSQDNISNTDKNSTNSENTTLVLNMDEAIRLSNSRNLNNSSEKPKQSTGSENTRKSLSNIKRPTLSHQASLSASAAEAGKFIVEKLASVQSEVKLKGAKDMLKAAASHLAGSKTQIKFQNLNTNDEEDEEDLDGVSDSTSDFNDTNNNTRRTSFTTKNKTGKLRTYANLGKAASQGGYRKAATSDEDNDDDEDDVYDSRDDDDDDYSCDDLKGSDLEFDDEEESDANDIRKLNRAASFRGVVKRGGVKHASANDPENRTGVRARSKSAGKLKRTTFAKNQSFGKRRFKKSTTNITTATNNNNINRKSFHDAEAALDRRGKSYRCLDNSVQLLIKSPLEQMILKISVIAIILVAIGIFTIFSIP